MVPAAVALTAGSTVAVFRRHCSGSALMCYILSVGSGRVVGRLLPGGLSGPLVGQHTFTLTMDDSSLQMHVSALLQLLRHGTKEKLSSKIPTPKIVQSNYC
eukprot:3720604-Amphidinium_carterae.1